MPTKRRVVRRRRRGRGFGIGDLWDGIKKAATVIEPILKSTKVLSKAAKFIPVAGPMASTVIDAVGYGRKRRRVRRKRLGGAMRGGNLSMMRTQLAF